MTVRQRASKIREWLQNFGLRKERLHLQHQERMKLIEIAGKVDAQAREDVGRREYAERVAELVEARQMAGAGPWQVSPAVLDATDRTIERALQRYGQPIAVRESNMSISAQGAFGDIELALQNVNWRREVQISWLEFTRWGIQQIILISRLYYVKHPWIRRGINISAAYVFGQGVELSSPDPDANDALKDFRERNKSSLGQIALTEQERRKGYDGNVFWCLFTDTQDSGDVNVRVIDATEVQEIVYDQNDAALPQYYHRVWTQKTFDVTSGQWNNQTGDEWYPAMNYEPPEKPQTIGSKPVKWDSPVYHRKCGHVANWTFGAPRVYPALDWAREGRKHLEACEGYTQSVSQIALRFTAKGGQQALEGIKQQWQTSVGPTSALLDQQPPAVFGSSFASGPGTEVEAFKARGMGCDPSEVKEIRNMVACALEVPPTWLADMETSNLSTAQTLDRPTELGFLSKQEEWQEDLVVMGRYQLRVSKLATGSKFRAALDRRKTGDVEIREAARQQRNGHWTYQEAKVRNPKVVEVMCSFPSIREGDIPALVKAVNDAMAIDRQGNQHGIDDKTAVRKFCDLLDISDADELVEKLYPEKTYVHDRTLEPEDEGTVPAPAIAPPAVPGAPPPAAAPPAPAGKEAARIRAALKRIDRVLRIEESNGHAQAIAALLDKRPPGSEDEDD